MEQPLMADAIATTFGAIVGTTTVTTYVESATGIEQEPH
jgi:AGZA family xanthine/uracil permease-like MFS transporter